MNAFFVSFQIYGQRKLDVVESWIPDNMIFSDRDFPTDKHDIEAMQKDIEDVMSYRYNGYCFVTIMNMLKLPTPELTERKDDESH